MERHAGNRNGDGDGDVDITVFDPRCTHMGCPYQWDVGGGVFQHFLLLQNVGEIVVGFGMFGLDLDRPTVAVGGLVETFLLFEDDPQLVVRTGVVR